MPIKCTIKQKIKPDTEIGQVYSINTDATYPYKPPRYGQYGEGKAFIAI